MKNTPQVHVVTNAPVAHASDLARRQRNYVILMVTRTLCFLGAVLLPVPLTLRLGLALGAVVLPYVAVVVANAGRERVRGADPVAPVQQDLPEIEGPQVAGPRA
jgi:hypothetical protein